MVDPTRRSCGPRIACSSKGARHGGQARRALAALEQKIAAAQGDEKKKLVAAQAEFGKKRAEAARALEQTSTDLEALDNPATRREELVRSSRATRPADRVRPRSRSNHRVKTRQSADHDVHHDHDSFADGKAVVDKNATRRRSPGRLHVDPIARERGARREANRQDRRREEPRLDDRQGLGRDKKSLEVERADGSKASVVKTEAKEISARAARTNRTYSTVVESTDSRVARSGCDAKPVFFRATTVNEWPCRRCRRAALH